MIFVDTNASYALLVADDLSHSRAARVHEQIRLGPKRDVALEVLA